MTRDYSDFGTWLCPCGPTGWDIRAEQGMNLWEFVLSVGIILAWMGDILNIAHGSTRMDTLNKTPRCLSSLSTGADAE